MFTDEVELTLVAGKGGNGIVSFFPGKKSGPNGGNGGDGGNLCVCASEHMTNLNQFVGKHILSAENGQSGENSDRHGADGKDLVVSFPVGTVLINQETLEEIQLQIPDEKVLICKGGFGGRGNTEFKSSRNTTPVFAENGRVGESKHFKILLKMIADFGLIGLPNAGKSSLLNELTNAKAPTASYPFTTLQPNLGVYKRKVIADIPGLIEGASEGKGLGVKFLKHIEKVKLLIHCISPESENPVKDYRAVMSELEKYNPQVAKKKQIVVITKSDLVDAKLAEELQKKLKKLQKIVIPCSIYDLESIDSLKAVLEKFNPVS